MDLDDAERRLDALLTNREQPGLFAQLWGLREEPLTVEADALAALFKALRLDGAASAAHRPQLLAAGRELLQNLEVVEGLAAARDRPPFAYVTWLWRVTETLRSVQREIEVAGQPSSAERKLPKPKERLPAVLHPLPPLRSGKRMQGFAIQPLIDLATRETRVLTRRRRLLEAARRALLESAAALDLPPEQVEPRLLAISEGIQQVTAWQQAGVDADEDVPHQLRRAVQMRDAQTVEQLLRVMGQLSRAAAKRPASFERMNLARRRLAASVRDRAAPPLAVAAEQAFGTAASVVLRTSEQAQLRPGAASVTATELTQAANAVDAAFELGRSVSPVRALEEQRRMAIVPFPTQTMVLQPSRRVADLPNSLISDPRLLIHQLATNSLLSRRYLAERKRLRTVPSRYAEARYYLLDGSASMGGRRGRMRDAILISELATMIRHLETGSAAARPIVYYRYFSKHAEPAVKVQTVPEALAAIEAVMMRKSQGETDIQAALVDSFGQIALERTRDSNLERAQVVLVSDGIAEIDLAAVWRARQALEGMPVRVSVIALGGESPLLKELAATQRARGEAVFYHYLSDRALYELMARTPIARPSASPATPRVRSPDSDEPSFASSAPASEPEPEPDEPSAPSDATPPPQAVWRELEHLVDELSVLQAPPDRERLEGAGLLEGAFDELGISLTDSGFEAERARAELARRDVRAIGLRFDRWFPAPETLASGVGMRPPPELIETIEIVLCTVQELTEYLAASPVSCQLDAIELLERLLLEAGVSPWAYSRALPYATSPSRGALSSLRGAAGCSAFAASRAT